MNDPTELLYQALAADGFGIKVETEDPERLRQKLYQLKRKSPHFGGLSFIISPYKPSGELWILKQGNPNAEEQ